MSKILNRLCLIFIGICINDIMGFTELSALYLLVAVCSSDILYVYPNTVFRMPICICYMALCIWYPQYLCYFPMLIYEMFLDSNGKYLIGAAGCILMYHTIIHPSFLMFAHILCALIALILKYEEHAHEKLKQTYIQQRDATKEVSLLLAEKNKNLMLQQDYEIKLATLDERNRIAREIHDHVGHQLSSSLLQVGALITLHQKEDIAAPLQDMKLTLMQAMDHIRNSVHNLHDDSLDLEMEITKLIKKFSFCPVKLNYDVMVSPNVKLSYHILAIIKEALTNIMKHSNASEASITLREQPSFYQLIIQDNGTDIVMHEDGIGLCNIKDRSEQFHGTMNIDTAKGFRIFITLYKEEKE